MDLINYCLVRCLHCQGQRQTAVDHSVSWEGHRLRPAGSPRPVPLQDQQEIRQDHCWSFPSRSPPIPRDSHPAKGSGLSRPKPHATRTVSSPWQWGSQTSPLYHTDSGSPPCTHACTHTYVLQCNLYTIGTTLIPNHCTLVPHMSNSLLFFLLMYLVFYIYIYIYIYTYIYIYIYIHICCFYVWCTNHTKSISCMWKYTSINQSNFICIAHIHKPQFVS